MIIGKSGQIWQKMKRLKRQRKQPLKGLMMKQEYEAWRFSVSEMSEAEIIAYFKWWGFTDELGHELTMCQPFLDLVAAVKKAEE